MLFSSTVFLFAFLPIILIVYYLAPGVLKNAVLCVGSLIFYAWGEPFYIFLMLVLILFNYFGALYLARSLKNRKRARKRLVLNIAVNLFAMVFLKYAEKIFGNVSIVLPMGFEQQLTPPIGISFYMLQILSYIIDVYRGEVKAEKSILNFAVYIAMFPRLASGPLVRYKDISEQLGKRKESLENLGDGALLFIRGLAKKVLLADEAGRIFQQIFLMESGKVSVLTAWLGCAAFAFQIYYDLSGYSDMAIGLGKMFGFEFKKNFYYPYMAKSVTEFWRRWHISLRLWFRDYVYIPLGGNRADGAGFTGGAILVWLLVALWHGASWNFLLWGIYFCLILLSENHLMGGALKKMPAFIGHLYCLLFVMTGWTFFFSPTPVSAVNYLKLMAGIGGHGVVDRQGIYFLVTNACLWLMLVLGASPAVHNLYERVIYGGKRVKTAANCMIYMVIFFLCIAYLVTEPYSPFLYFRF